MHDPADDPAIVYPLDTAHIARQIRPNSSPLLVAQPKQILAHDPDPLPKTNQDRILSAQKLMSFDPSMVRTRDRFGMWIAAVAVAIEGLCKRFMSF